MDPLQNGGKSGKVAKNLGNSQKNRQKLQEFHILFSEIIFLEHMNNKLKNNKKNYTFEYYIFDGKNQEKS